MNMDMKRTSTFSNGLIWFGAAVSIAEILTGTYFAPLGPVKGIMAVLLGHLIGGVLLFLAGFIGAGTRRSAMETVKMSFGQRGSFLFAILNIIQLAGWTSIMVYDGAAATNEILRAGAWIWCLVIGVLIIVWILVGVTHLGKLNTVAMTALFVLSVILCIVIFRGGSAGILSEEEISFGAAVELAAAMPLSWLPLISDYTREAKKPLKATLASAVVYGIVSSWMYLIGMGAVLYTGEYDIAAIMVKAGLGIAGLLIIIFATVTTTFMDAYSAGVSAEAVSDKLNSKWVAVIIAIAGTIAAMLFPMEDITDFLYLIGSVFAPMIAIQIADYFILKKDYMGSKYNLGNLLIWLAGFILYRILMKMDIPVGNTLPDMLVTILLCILVNKITIPAKK